MAKVQRNDRARAARASSTRNAAWATPSQRSCAAGSRHHLCLPGNRFLVKDDNRNEFTQGAIQRFDAAGGLDPEATN